VGSSRITGKHAEPVSGTHLLLQVHKLRDTRHCGVFFLAPRAGMNEIDIVIVLIVGLSIYYAAVRGVVTGLVDLLSIPLGVGLGSLIWRPAAALLGAFGFPSFLAGLLGFALVAVGVAVGIVYLGTWLARDLHPGKLLDGIGGGVTGLFFGLLFSALTLVGSGLIPNVSVPLEHSFLGPRVIRLVPDSYTALERFGVALPKLAVFPPDYKEEFTRARRAPRFLQINFSRLEGATCIKCGRRVHFLGYQFRRGTFISPKFQCPNCGRTSDGCQTFEGFHRIYGRCPVALAREGIRFDCGVWTNGEFVSPKGVCPIDGNHLEAEPGAAIIGQYQPRSAPAAAVPE